MITHQRVHMSYNLTAQERFNLKQLRDYSAIASLPEIWKLAQQQFGATIALKDPHSEPEVVITYTELYQQIQQFAAGLQALDVQAGSRIGLIADNSPRWLIADQGAIASGAVNVVRSAQAERQELLFILENSGSTALIAENLQTLQKLRADLDSLPIAFVVLLSDEQPPDTNLKVLNFPQLMSLGTNYPLTPVQQNRDTLATLMYTSGTTGKPKGVMLTHGNLLHQVETLGTIVQPQAGDRVLSILPTWHVYERTGEYFLLSQGCTQIYTNIRQVKKDIKQFKPNYMVGVPRLWESIYEGVQKQFREQPLSKQRLIDSLLAKSQQYIKARRITQNLSLDILNPNFRQRLAAEMQVIALYPLHALADKIVYQKVREATGGELKQVISGGGSLAMHLENFFEIVSVEILVGYGLTETSPVTNARRLWRNLRGSAGQPLPGTKIRIVDPDTRKILPIGQRGLVMVQGPQIMQGYYQNPEATAKAIDADGWFDTGDLGWLTSDNDLVLTGRAKDTIVLTNGENIEPQPIEDACLRSPYIDQIMLVGQDQKSLGALIVPNIEALQQWAATQNLELLPTPYGQGTALSPQGTALSPQVQGKAMPCPDKPKINLNDKLIQNLFQQELNREVQNRPGYRIDDRIGPFELILDPFSIENGMMTQTLKIRRPVVSERYHDIINKMFA